LAVRQIVSSIAHPKKGNLNQTSHAQLSRLVVSGRRGARTRAGDRRRKGFIIPASTHPVPSPHPPHPSPLLPVHLPLHGAPAWEVSVAWRRPRCRAIDSAWMSIAGCAGGGALCGGLGQAAEGKGQSACDTQGWPENSPGHWGRN
jgi:hypothetical protein